MSKKAKGAGNYYQPLPVDFAILETLPDVGTIGGIHWRGRRAVDIADQLNLDGFDSLNVGDRLRSMSAGKVIRSFPGGGRGGTKIWARTPEGSALLKRRGEYLGS